MINYMYRLNGHVDGQVKTKGHSWYKAVPAHM